jgi:hypothetical protein
MVNTFLMLTIFSQVLRLMDKQPGYAFTWLFETLGNSIDCLIGGRDVLRSDLLRMSCPHELIALGWGWGRNLRSMRWVLMTATDAPHAVAILRR